MQAKEKLMRYGVKSHSAVIIIFAAITLFTLVRQWIAGSWHGMMAMSDFMAGFFLIFGMFKIIDLQGFVTAYKKYNLIAKHLSLYAYAVPFIHLGLGVAYLFRVYPLASNSINFVVMTLGFISVLIKLIKKKVIPCACLGTLFKHPLSLMSLFENALMVIMSLSMVLYHFYRF